MRPGPSGAGPGMHAGKLDGRADASYWVLLRYLRYKKTEAAVTPLTIIWSGSRFCVLQVFIWNF